MASSCGSRPVAESQDRKGLTPTEVVRRYYDAYAQGDLVDTASWVHEDCIIDEPTFLPYGRIDVIGAHAMFDHVGGVFFQLFAPETGLEDTRYFEDGSDVITNAVWVMTGLHTGRTLRCHYQEFFTVRDGKISLMRPFYHAAKEMIEEMEAAEMKGIDLTPCGPALAG